MKRPIKVNIFFLILILLQVFGGYIIRPISKVIKFTVASSLLTTQLMFLILPVIIYFIITRQSIKETLRFNKIKIRSIGLIAVMGFLFVPVGMFLGQVTSFFFYNNVQDVFNKLQSLPLGLMLGVVALTPALCEEITMRGVVLSGYNGSKLWKAALINGFLFAVLHLNPPQFLYALVLGVMLAYVVRITNSIFASMIIHFIFNGTNTLLSWWSMKVNSTAAIKKSQAMLNNTSAKIMATVFLGVIAIIAVAAIVTLIKELIKDNKENLNNVNLLPSGSAEVMLLKDKIAAAVPVVISVVIYFLLVMKRI
ncbi:CPBP family intramembrane glutamic endopeptidase [Clostridium neuense]|uniref:CPBP family intramembrane glutamic endopeptidase n=1 Tax=Clostridium neuense TaxID=1728934 RepID=A0ABW8TGH4_9CLOT